MGRHTITEGRLIGRGEPVATGSLSEQTTLHGDTRGHSLMTRSRDYVSVERAFFNQFAGIYYIRNGLRSESEWRAGRQHGKATVYSRL